MRKWIPALLTFFCGVLLIGSFWVALASTPDVTSGTTHELRLSAPPANIPFESTLHLSALSPSAPAPSVRLRAAPTQRKLEGPIHLQVPPMGADGIKQAMDAIGSDDEKTYRNGLRLLAGCTPDDLPAIEPFTANPIPKIREQAKYQHKRLSGTVFAFEAFYPDGVPAENVKLEFTIHLALTDDERRKYQGMQQDVDLLQPVASTGECTTDASGLAPAAALADGDYIAYIGASGPVPGQTIKQAIHLTADTNVVRVQVLQGCNLAIRVADREGNPIENATVLIPWITRGRNGLTTSELLRQARERTEPHQTNRQGLCGLGILGRTTINIAAAKPGYAPVCELNVALKDGEYLEKVLTLDPAPAGMVALHLTNLPSGVVPAHVVFLEGTRDQDLRMKKQGLLANNATSRLALLDAGGVDAGPGDAGGCVKVSLMPDNYVVYAFANETDTVLQGSCEIPYPLPAKPIALALYPAGR